MSKADRLAGALGSLDELNSWVGVCRATSPSPSPKLWRGEIKGVRLDDELKRIQNNIMIISIVLVEALLRQDFGRILKER